MGILSCLLAAASSLHLLHPLLLHPGGGASYQQVSRLHKREAEAEANPHLGYYGLPHRLPQLARSPCSRILLHLLWLPRQEERRASWVSSPCSLPPCSPASPLPPPPGADSHGRGDRVRRWLRGEANPRPARLLLPVRHQGGR